MRHNSELPNIARIGALIGNPVRAQLIGILMDGSERSASELAELMRGTPQSMSAHLTGLVAGGILTVRPQGRHRFFRLRSEQVAWAIEVLSLTATESLQPATFGQRIRSAHRCYDHVAGRLGVAMCDYAVAHRYVIVGAEGAALSKAGGLWLRSLDIEPPPGLRRPLVRFCQDGTERRPHLAGWLGAALCRRLEEQDVIRRLSGSRVLTVTPTGRAVLADLFNVRSAQIDGREASWRSAHQGARENVRCPSRAFQWRSG